MFAICNAMASEQSSPYFLENFASLSETEWMEASSENIADLLGENWTTKNPGFTFAVGDKTEIDFDNVLRLRTPNTLGTFDITRVLDQEVSSGKHKVVASTYIYSIGDYNADGVYDELEETLGILGGILITGGDDGNTTLLQLRMSNNGAEGFVASVCNQDAMMMSTWKYEDCLQDIEVICDLDATVPTMDINLYVEGPVGSDRVCEGFAVEVDYENNRSRLYNIEPIEVPEMTKITSVSLMQACTNAAKRRQSAFDYFGFVPVDREYDTGAIIKRANLITMDSTGVKMEVELTDVEGVTLPVTVITAEGSTLRSAKFKVYTDDSGEDVVDVVKDRSNLDYTIIAALYQDNRLVGVDLKKSSEIGDSNSFELFLENTQDVFVPSGTIRLYLWDKELTPLEIFKQELEGMHYMTETEPLIGARHFDTSKYMPDEEKVQARLEEYEGVHPRLLYTADEWADVRAAYNNLTAEEKAEIQVVADSAMNAEIYVYDATHEGEQREIGTRMEQLSTMYMLTEDENYLNRAKEWIALAIDPERMPTYGVNEKGIACGHIIHGLAVAYDLLYHELDEDTKAGMRTMMIDRGKPLANRWAGENFYLHNFQFVFAAGIMHVYYALYDETDELDYFLPLTQRRFAGTYAAMSEDGACAEGSGYWSYGLDMHHKCMMLMERMWDFDPIEEVEWITNTALKYRLHISFPENSRTDAKYMAYFGDCNGYDFHNLNTLYYQIAAKKNLPVLTWLASRHRNIGYQGDKQEGILSFYYRNQAPAAVTPEEAGIPTFHHFTDFDMVAARSGWDGNESAVFFKCGPNQGRKASYFARAFEDDYDLGAGHAHPDVNHFILVGGGAQLLIDDQYEYDKQTGQHNTLLVNGSGQIGERGTWYLPKTRSVVYNMPYIKTTKTTDQYDYFVGAGAYAYDASLGVERFDRHMLFVKEKDILLVLDDIETKEEADLELRFFPRYDGYTETNGGLLVNGLKNKLFVKNLTPENSDLAYEIFEDYSRADTDQPMFTVKKTTNSLQTVTALSWSTPSGTPNMNIDLVQNGDSYEFTIDDEKFILDLNNLQVNYARSE